MYVLVLALAYGSSMEDLVFVGMVGLLDPPRDGIQDAVLTLLSTGAHLKMVTGDAEETALAIGDQHTAFVYYTVKPVVFVCLYLLGVVVSMVALISDVNLRRARLVLRWATVSGFNSRCRKFISVCNQPATQGQLSLHPSGVGK